MRGTKLYSILIQLNSKSRKRFGKYLNSPYLNGKSAPILLLNHFNKEIKRGAKGKLLKKEVFAAIYPSLNYNDQKLRLLYSDTFALLKDFLVFENYRSSKKVDKSDLADSFNELGKNKLYLKTLEEECNRLENEGIRDSQYFLEMYNLRKMIYDQKTFETRIKDQKLESVIEHFDTYFYMEKLRQGCLILSQKRLSDKDYDTDLLDIIVSYLEGKPSILQNNPSLAVYYYGYKSLAESEEEEHFKNFRTLLVKHIDLFTAKDGRELFILALNYCGKKINLELLDYAKIYFDLCKIGLSKGCIATKNSISTYSYKNVLAIGILTKEFEWTEFFLEKYKELLPKKNGNDIYKLGKSALRFSTAQYLEAISILKEFYSEDPLFTLNSNTLLIRSYYEIGDLDAIGTTIEKMKVYLSRKKNLGYHENKFKALIKYTKKFINLPLYAKAERLKLLEEINNPDNFIPSKAWFLAKIKEGLPQS